MDTPNPGVNASFTISTGNYIEFELLNSGSEVMELNNTWILLNGTEPYNLGSLTHLAYHHGIGIKVRLFRYK